MLVAERWVQLASDSRNYGKGNSASMAKPQAKITNRRVRQLAQEPARTSSAGAMPLNFKVPSDFRREFKTYAAQHNKKLNQLLYEAFAALKAQK